MSPKCSLVFLIALLLKMNPAAAQSSKALGSLLFKDDALLSNNVKADRQQPDGETPRLDPELERRTLVQTFLKCHDDCTLSEHSYIAKEDAEYNFAGLNEIEVVYAKYAAIAPHGFQNIPEVLGPILSGEQSSLVLIYTECDVEEQKTRWDKFKKAEELYQDMTDVLLDEENKSKSPFLKPPNDVGLHVDPITDILKKIKEREKEKIAAEKTYKDAKCNGSYEGVQTKKGEEANVEACNGSGIKEALAKIAEAKNKVNIARKIFDKASEGNNMEQIKEAEVSLKRAEGQWEKTTEGEDCLKGLNANAAAEAAGKIFDDLSPAGYSRDPEKVDSVPLASKWAKPAPKAPEEKPKLE